MFSFLQSYVSFGTIQVLFSTTFFIFDAFLMQF